VGEREGEERERRRTFSQLSKALKGRGTRKEGRYPHQGVVLTTLFASDLQRAAGRRGECWRG